MPAADQLPRQLNQDGYLYIGNQERKIKISKGDIFRLPLQEGAGLQSTEIGKIDVNDRYAYAAISPNEAAAAY